MVCLCCQHSTLCLCDACSTQACTIGMHWCVLWLCSLSFARVCVCVFMFSVPCSHNIKAYRLMAGSYLFPHHSPYVSCVFVHYRGSSCSQFHDGETDLQTSIGCQLSNPNPYFKTQNSYIVYYNINITVIPIIPVD